MASSTTCPNCGVPVTPADRFCMACGAGLTSAKAAPAALPSQIRARVLFWLVPLLVLTIVLVALVTSDLACTGSLAPLPGERSSGATTAPSGERAQTPTSILDPERETELTPTLASAPVTTPSTRSAPQPTAAASIEATTSATKTASATEAGIEALLNASVARDMSDLVDLAPHEVRRFGRGALNDFAVSPSGDLLAVATGLGVWLYHLDAPQDQGELLEHESMAAAVSWSPDGERLAVHELAGQIRLWNPRTGVLERSIGSCGGNLPSDIEWSPDGAHLAVFCGQSAALHDATTGKWLANCARLLNSARFSWSPDGKHLAIAATVSGEQLQRSLDVCDATTGKLERNLLTSNSGDFAYDVAWSPDNTYIAAEVRRRTANQPMNGDTTQSQSTTVIRLWDSFTGQVARELKLDGRALSMAWSADGKRLAVQQTERIAVFDPSTGEAVELMKSKAVPSSSNVPLSWSPDGASFVVGSWGGVVSVLDSTTGALARIYPGHSHLTNALPWSADGRFVAAANEWGTLDAWNAASGQPLAQYPLPGVLALSPDWSRAVVWGYLSDRPQIRSVTDGSLICDLPGDTESADIATTWSPDGQWITTRLDRRIFQVSSGRDCAPTSQAEESSPIEAVQWSPDGKLVAYVTNNGSTIRVWTANSVGDGVPWTADLDTQVEALAWSPDASKLAALDNASYLYVLETGYRQPSELLRVRLEIGQDAAVNLAWSPDGSRVATGTVNGNVAVFGATTGQLLMMLDGHGSWVDAIHWSPDSSKLLSSAHDGTVRVWDVSDAAALAPVAAAPTPSAPVVESAAPAPTSTPAPAAGSLAGRIVFLSSRDYHDFRPDAPADLRPHDIYAMNPDGSGVRRITNGLRLINIGAPVVSPDGSQIIVGGYSPGGARLFSADGALLQKISLPGKGGWALDWSPDGKVLFCIFMEGGQEEELYSLDVVTGAATRLTNDDVRELFASWSPDGRQIAFMRDYTLWTMNADGSGQKQVVDGEARDVDWSPDGALIAMESDETPHQGMDFEVYLIKPDGTERRALTNTPGVMLYNPGWSPDGTRLVVESYADYPPKEGQISVVDAQNGALTTLTSEGNNFAPFWAQVQ